MSGHGKREARLLVDAIAWRDRVIDDVRGEGRAAARAHEVSVDLVIAAAAIKGVLLDADKGSHSNAD